MRNSHFTKGQGFTYLPSTPSSAKLLSFSLAVSEGYIVSESQLGARSLSLSLCVSLSFSHPRLRAQLPNNTD